MADLESISPIISLDISNQSAHRTPHAPRRTITPRQALDTLELGLTQANDIQHLFENYIQQMDKQSISVRLKIDKQFDRIVKELMQRKETLHDEINTWKAHKLMQVNRELDDAIKYEEALLKAQNKSNEILNSKTLDMSQKKDGMKQIRNAISSDTKFAKYKDSDKVTSYINDVTQLVDIRYADSISFSAISEYGQIVSNTDAAVLSVPTLNLLKPIKARESKNGYKLKLKWVSSHALTGDHFIVRCFAVDDKHDTHDDDEKRQQTKEKEWKSLRFELKETNDKRTTFEASNVESVFLFDKQYIFRVEYHVTDPVNLLIGSNEQAFTLQNLPPSANTADYIELEYFGCKGFSYEGHPRYLLSDKEAKMYRSKPNKDFDYGENDWIVFELKHSGFIRQYLPKAVKIKNSRGNQALRHLIVSIGNKGDATEWLKYDMIRLENNDEEYQQIMLEGVDWKEIKQMKKQFVKLELMKNYGESRGAQCRFKVHEVQLYGLEFK